MTKSSLPPGFRFHPTDVELLKFYLTRKVRGKRISVDVISELDIYKFCPWDLPEKSCLRSKDLEWYFFCRREKKYLNGARMNRATEYGYWKTTGKDRSVRYKEQAVGMIKTLIFHTGKAPRGDRTDWVMHEYRLEDKALADGGIVQDAYVICKIFQKSGPGPKNGAQYGAPFNEEEWSDDEVDCIESISIADLSGPPPSLHNNPSNSALTTSRFIPATICIGSSSVTTPSKTVQCSSVTTPSKTVQCSSVTTPSKTVQCSSVTTPSKKVPCSDNMFLPLSEDDVSMLDTLLSDDMISSLVACHSGDTTAVYNHEQNEILDKVNHDDIILTVSLDGNNVYGSLGEIVKLWDLAEFQSSNGSETDLSNNHMLGFEDGINWDDLLYPLEEPSNMNEPRCTSTSIVPSHFN